MAFRTLRLEEALRLIHDVPEVSQVFTSIFDNGSFDLQVNCSFRIYSRIKSKFSDFYWDYYAGRTHPSYRYLLRYDDFHERRPCCIISYSLGLTSYFRRPDSRGAYIRTSDSWRFENWRRKKARKDVKMYLTEFSDKKGECSICLDEFTALDKTLCNHTFCESCIRTWLEKNNTCPLCRKCIIYKS